MKRFKRIYIEISNICNLSCAFCPESKRNALSMSTLQFEEILKQVTPFTDYIYLHIKGEPLLHPDLSSLLDLCESYQVHVNITTNGTLIKNVSEGLLGKKAIRQMNFSLHSFDEQPVSKTLTKEKYINDILAFIDHALDRTNILFSLRFWNHQKDESETSNEEILKIIEDYYQIYFKIEEKVESGRGIKLKERVFINQDYEFVWPSLNAKEDDGKGFCYGLRNQIGILSDGTVVPCCLDAEGDINLGNLFLTPFSQIIESERVQNIIDGFSQRIAVEELCRKCGFRQKFGK